MSRTSPANAATALLESRVPGLVSSPDQAEPPYRPGVAHLRDRGRGCGRVVLTRRGISAANARDRRTDDADDWRADGTRDQRHLGYGHATGQGPTQGGRRPQAGSYQDLEVTTRLPPRLTKTANTSSANHASAPSQTNTTAQTNAQLYGGSTTAVHSSPPVSTPSVPSRPTITAPSRSSTGSTTGDVAQHRVGERIYHPDRTKCR